MCAGGGSVWHPGTEIPKYRFHLTAWQFVLTHGGTKTAFIGTHLVGD